MRWRRSTSAIAGRLRPVYAPVDALRLGSQMATMHAVHQVRPPASTAQRRTDLRVHQLDTEGLIYDPRSSDTHHLNSTAMFIWLRCDGLQPQGEIAEALAAHFEVSASAASKHVERTLEEFRKRRLLVGDVDAEETDA